MGGHVTEVNPALIPARLALRTHIPCWVPLRWSTHTPLLDPLPSPTHPHTPPPTALRSTFQVWSLANAMLEGFQCPPLNGEPMPWNGGPEPLNGGAKGFKW